MAKRRFGDYDASLAMRDAIKKIVGEEIQSLRPVYRYGVVSSVNLATKTAQVVYNGEVDPVTISIGHFIFTKTGDVVRIEGVGTDKFVADIIGWDGTGLGASLPDGGVAGEALVKQSSVDGDADWEPIQQNIFQVHSTVGDAIFCFAPTTADPYPGCVWLEGQPLSRTGYPALFAKYGTRFGAGDGVNTFNVPDTRGMVPVGYKASGAFAGAIGSTVGEETHLLTTSELAAHQHGPGSNTYFNTVGTTGTRQTLAAGGSWWVTTSTTLADVGSSGLTASAGGGQAHNNVQPSLIGRWYTRYEDVTLAPPGTTASIAPTPNTVVQRDAAGHIEVAAGVSAEDVANLGQVPNPNLVIDGRFRINQSGYVSGTDKALGAFALDMYKASTANSRMTFTAEPQGQMVTVAAGGSFSQTLERANFVPGNYTLSWEGTTTMRMYNVGATPPAYAASPLTVNIDGTANVVWEFGPGTVDKVKLERGAVATPYMLPPVDEELRRVHRQFVRLTATVLGQRVAGGFQVGTTMSEVLVTLPVPPRSQPSITASGMQWTDGVGFNAAISGFTIAAYQAGIALSTVAFYATFPANGVAFRPGWISAASAGAYLQFDSRL